MSDEPKRLSISDAIFGKRQADLMSFDLNLGGLSAPLAAGRKR
jgi:hypothetical protein